MKAYIYGLGKGKQALDRCLIRNSVDIIAYIDRYKAKETRLYEGIPVMSAEEILAGYDAVIITLMQYADIREELCDLGVPDEKIICFYSFDDAACSDYWECIDGFKWRTELMWKNYTEIVMPTIRNYPYELYAAKLTAHQELPSIVPVKKTVEIIRKEGKSLARFGDNEFEQICGRRRVNYQAVNSDLGTRLRKVLDSNLDNLLIAIADNYGSLEKYTDDAASAIRQYLGRGTTRAEHMQLLDMSRTYYDAYLSRPYLIYRNKEEAGARFRDVRNIWTNQDILIVEGEHTRFGVGNDLMENAKSVQRILTLDKNCFDVYDNLIRKVKEYSRDKLVLIILGPVATVMAYDLAKEDFWALDIGQLDVEYEWYLRQVTERCGIAYKTVSEVPEYDDIETDPGADYIRKYRSEIVESVTE